MGDGVWKLHHPCFFPFFDYGRACGGFQIHSGSFYPSWFDDIFFGLYDDFCAFLRCGIYRNNRSVLASNTDRHKKPNHTTGIGLRAVTRRAYLRPCKHRKHVLERKQCVGASGYLRQLCSKPEVGPSGFFCKNGDKIPSRWQELFWAIAGELKK